MNAFYSWLHYSLSPTVLVIFSVLYLYLFGDIQLFILTSLFVYLFACSRVFSIYTRKRMKAGLLVTYTALLPLQWVSLNVVVFDASLTGWLAHVAKLCGVFFVLMPFVIERITTSTRHTVLSVPSISEAGTISYAMMSRAKSDFRSTVEKTKQLKDSVSIDNLTEIIEDLPRHSSTSYINNESLTEAYFNQAERSLDDPYVYIVVSNTGSAASELISVFTQKPFNHVSFSFDENLDTILSYNGGEHVYPPGLNAEMIEFFNQKEGASMIVYRLHAGNEKKAAMIEQVRHINEQGSAYNLLGLVFKYSHRPNIMFCSQFVYSLLKKVDLNYFERKAELVKPTDLVELDYFRKLEFVREVSFADL